jgi:hypothetical protein
VLKWLKRIIDGDQRSINELLEEYALLLENYPAAILDVSMLPLPKDKMKTILKLLYEEQTDPCFQDYFEKGFLALSRFQKGVGIGPIHALLPSEDASSLLDGNMPAAIQNKLLQESVATELGDLVCEWERIKEGSERSH